MLYTRNRLSCSAQFVFHVGGFSSSYGIPPYPSLAPLKPIQQASGLTCGDNNVSTARFPSMSGSSRLDGRPHVQNPQPQIASRNIAEAAEHDSRHHDTIDHRNRRVGASPPKPESSMAVNIRSEPPSDQSASNSNRQISQSSVSAGLVPVAQGKHSEYMKTQEYISHYQPSSEPAGTNRHASTDGQQTMSEPLASTIRKSHSPSMTVPRSPSRNNPAPKRNAAGISKHLNDAPGVDHTSEVDSPNRRRSHSIGSLSRESRIAAVRLAPYISSRGLAHRLSTSTESLAKAGLLPAFSEIEAQRLAENSSPNGTIMSAPDVPSTANAYTPSGPGRLSPVAQSADASPSSLQSDMPKSHLRPKLAPPADIASGSRSRRRRPNPNEALHQSKFPVSVHRRHRSHQEVGVSRQAANSEKVQVPGTPPLRPTSQASYNSTAGHQNHLRSSAMEQDAIETLLFMSSPGHSGYHSGSQHSQRQRNIFQSSSDSRSSGGRVPHSQDLQVSNSHGQSMPASSGRTVGLASHAGDEIDRMLDQMDSDSDDEVKFASTQSSFTDRSSKQADSSQEHNR
ncbi:hypothetical protein ASPBRDRAFT_51878 [Aspergillus brasiliensis CBS 101740]|uniref:Uncharacterized protein n=1 Tax=Aspergillus brasiliensis (strain CBS 101740 / IMI 381727 / IBT 21946) TaxID=767769 RepID=A0A1L9UX05_ASPBC|nr:hypothetical protein ASPBRDRAFT_51878 [Aspergillus brasiliensis CBS 101740]